MIKHVVLFKFTDDPNKTSIMEQIKVELEKLVDVIDELQAIEVGININPAETWELGLISEFNSMEDMEIYAKHPAHVKIVQELILPIKLERSCIDYIC